MRKYNKYNLTYEFLHNQYCVLKKSANEIAEKVNVHSMTIIRRLKKFGIQVRDKGEAQVNALQTGRSQHPTEGTTRSEETKQKISEQASENWDEGKYEGQSEKAKAQWEKMTDEQKAEFHKQGARAVYQTTIDGSKLEKKLAEGLRAAQYKCDRHVKRKIRNERFHIDILLHYPNIAIEVDGPVHFDPIYGEERLERNRAKDKRKDGLMTEMGLIIIRVRQHCQTLSLKKGRDALTEVLRIVDGVRDGTLTETYFTVEI